MKTLNRKRFDKWYSAYNILDHFDDLFEIILKGGDYMKVTGRVEIFKGENGLLAKITAFNSESKPTGAVYMPVRLPESCKCKEGQSLTVMVKDGFLNAVTSTGQTGTFTHLAMNIKDCEVLSIYEKE